MESQNSVELEKVRETNKYVHSQEKVAERMIKQSQKDAVEEMTEQSRGTVDEETKSSTLDDSVVNQAWMLRTLKDDTCVGQIGPAPMEHVIDAMNSVCKIKIGKTTVATGSLLKFRLNQHIELKGLLTNNHVISPDEFLDRQLNCQLIFECLRSGELTVNLKWTGREYAYYTSMKEEMDATFIELPPKVIETLDKRDVLWLTIHSDDAKKGDRTFILQYPAEHSTGRAAIAIGKVHALKEVELKQPGKKYWLFEHLVDTERGSSGSPVITYDGKLIGLHRCAFASVNGATNARCILNAMIDHFNRQKYVPRTDCLEANMARAHRATIGGNFNDHTATKLIKLLQKDGNKFASTLHSNGKLTDEEFTQLTDVSCLSSPTKAKEVLLPMLNSDEKVEYLQEALIAADEYFTFQKLAGVKLIEKFPTGEIEGVAGVACFKERIYVICWRSRLVHVFKDDGEFDEIEGDMIEIQTAHDILRDPYDMRINQNKREMFIGEYQHKSIWKIDLRNKFVSRQTIDKKPRGMSLTSSDGLLVAVWKDHPPTSFFLNIYRQWDLTEEASMASPENVKRIDHAVQTSYGSFIVSHENLRSVYVISEMSRCGDNLRIMQTLNPGEGLESWFPYQLAIDEDGRILIADNSPLGRRVFLLNSEMTRMEVLLNVDQHQVARPSRLCYLPEKHQLLLGQGRSYTNSAGYPSSVSIFELNI